MKVSSRRRLPAADAGTRLSTHELPRVRAVAMRLLGTSGDTEHVDAALAGLADPAAEARGAAARAGELMRRRLALRGPARAFTWSERIPGGGPPASGVSPRAGCSGLRGR